MKNVPMRVSGRCRIRELIPKLPLGSFSPGSLNSITDVPGVLVSTRSIHADAHKGEHDIINTGVTVILPRHNIWDLACHAGIFAFNGAGELTGAHEIRESGLLSSPIIITGTFGIGAAHEGALRHFVRDRRDDRGLVKSITLPVVAETYDGRLHDVSSFAVRPEHVTDAIDQAQGGLVAEGCTGGGTGMIAHGFKAGTGTASRRIPAPVGWEGKETHFHLGALVQANYGLMKHLRVGGVPVGLHFAKSPPSTIDPKDEPARDGSIIIVLATDAPILPLQLQRLAKRATVGLARVGGNGNNYSGDIFLAFSTAAEVPIMADPSDKDKARHLPAILLDEDMDAYFEAAGDVVEEAIYNALCMATTMTGPLGTIQAIDLSLLKSLVEPRLLPDI